jgi:hypothetical protein
VLALEHPLPRARPAFFQRTPGVALGVLAVAWAAAHAALPGEWARVAGLAAAQGALLGTALAWTSRRDSRDGWAPLEAALLLAGAAGIALSFAWGGLAYAVLPLWLAWRRPAWLTTFRTPPGPALVTGGLLGAALGAHLLVNASLTLGYRVRTGSWAELVGWWGYDLGANVLAGEAFFRGALFERAWRRWSFAAAAALSTAASLARYLVDPLLPRSLEIAAGAAFYLILLGCGNCWLLARTGSLGPPLVAAATFFGAYRLLTH